MVDTNRKIDLEIKNITIEEAKKIMELVRGFEKEEPRRTIFSQIKGLDDLTSLEAGEILLHIFPHLKHAT